MSLLFPFSPKGVQDKLTELYALTDNDLAQQATAIKTNFTQWILANFSFGPAQVIYINNLNVNVAEYYGVQCALCFTNRLPIILIYPAPPSDAGYAKWSVSDDGLHVEANGLGQASVSGSLTFSIVYK